MSTLTIPRHCVGSDPQTGLSKLQTALLHSDKKIRIADAPTGAGKSYAFVRALLDTGARVLFIVPTRRLAQNLARGLLEDLEKAGWDETRRENKVTLWSSDASRKLREAGFRQIGSRRIREIFNLDETREGGEMIIAVPEVVSGILLRKGSAQGQSGEGIFDFLTNFEHIVFDEFHTIQARGFGLAAVFAKLAAEGVGRARVSFLSATPLDIQPTLLKLAVPEKQIEVLQEAVGDTGRPVHGDVQLRFEDGPSMAALLARHTDKITSELKQAERQVVVIYNRLVDLQEQISDLERVVEQCGIAPQECLLINSIDDSRAEVREPGRFAVGRGLDPLQFRLLIATSSVEMGVTFRANLLFMEPGFQPLNFLQRYGRAARGEFAGEVIVRVDEALRRKENWLRQLLSWAEGHAGQRIEIGELTRQLSTAAMEAFKPADETKFFGRLPNRATYLAGLYWQVLLQQPSNKGHRAEHLKQHLPTQAKTVFALLRQVREMEQDRVIGAAAREWCVRFEQEARTLRDIGRSVRVVASDDTRTIGILWLKRNAPEVLEGGRWREGEDGQTEVVINFPFRVSEQKRYQVEQIQVFFPHRSTPELVKLDGDLVKTWCRLLRDTRGPAGEAWEDYPQAMAAAENLVQRTGLVVGEPDDSELDTAAGVL